MRAASRTRTAFAAGALLLGVTGCGDLELGEPGDGVGSGGAGGAPGAV
ncbi:MAG: hypothetical protein WKG00_34790 [Polyangiaceae bacterium]